MPFINKKIPNRMDICCQKNFKMFHKAQLYEDEVNIPEIPTKCEKKKMIFNVVIKLYNFDRIIIL